MLDFLYNHRKSILITVILLVFAAVAATIFIIFHNQKQLQDTNLTITNFNQAIKEDKPSLSNQIAFQSELYTNILTLANLPEGTVIPDITIRESSYSASTADGFTTANFIIDIDSLQQSYAITSYTWSNNNELEEEIPNNAVIDCPPIQDSKYPESFCQGMYNNSITATLNQYLPAARSIDLTYTYILSYNPSVQNGLLLTTETCEDNVLSLATEDTLLWLNSLNLTPFLNHLSLETACQ